MTEASLRLVLKFLVIVAMLALFTKLSVDAVILGAVAFLLWHHIPTKGVFASWHF